MKKSNLPLSPEEALWLSQLRIKELFKGLRKKALPFNMRHALTSEQYEQYYDMDDSYWDCEH